MNRIYKLIPVVLLFITMQSTAQIGIRLHHQTLHARSWEAIADRSGLNPAYSSSVIGLGLDYWFRLEDYRVEFFPEIGYTSHAAFKISDHDLSYNSYYARLNTHFYVLDFEADCNCPTFSNQSPWFRKGFFLMLAAGAALQQYPAIELNADKFSQYIFQAGLGAGVDIGIIDLITLTPYVTYMYHITPEWTGLATTLEVDSEQSREKSTLTSVQAGLRVGFRF